MDPSIRPKHHTDDRVFTLPQTTYNLTIMDTNTKVTNSPLASVNPTPVPCGLSSEPQHTILAPSAHLSQIAHPGHVLVAKSIQATGPITSLPLFGDATTPRAATGTQIRELQNQTGPTEGTTANLQNSLYRPILITHNATNTVRAQGQGPGPRNVLKPAPSGVVLTGLLTMDGASGDNSTKTRIAHLLSPAGPPTPNTQLLLYCPQSKVVKDPNKPGQTGEERNAQQPTMYYAVASAQLLRQLQGNTATSGQNPSSKPHLVQTPAGIMLLQPNTGLSSLGMVGSVRGQPMPAHKSIPASMMPLEHSTLPRASGTEHGLICTCPPEANHVVFEQQKKLKHQQPQQLNHAEPQDRVSMRDNQANEQYSTQLSSYALLENSGCQRGFAESHADQQTEQMTTSAIMTSATNEKHTEVTHFQQNSANPIESSPPMKHRGENESHVNYLVTLFQALRASGVQPEAFRTAFNLTDLAHSDPHPQAQKLKNRHIPGLGELRSSLNELRRMEQTFRATITTELHRYQENAIRLLTEYHDRNSFISTRSDRSALDRMLLQLRQSQASLETQLHDLECVLEQTGNDVLQHRCRITLSYVQTLEDRLDSINRAVGSTRGIYPEVRQSLENHEETQRREIEAEKRRLENGIHQLDDIGSKCKRIKGTILTLKRLAMVNVQNRQQSTSPRRFAHLGGVMNRAAADPNSIERNRLYASIRSIQPDSQKRLQAIQKQTNLALQRKRVLSFDPGHEAIQPSDSSSVAKCKPSSSVSKKPAKTNKQTLTSKEEMIDPTTSGETASTITPVTQVVNNDEDWKTDRLAESEIHSTAMCEYSDNRYVDQTKIIKGAPHITPNCINCPIIEEQSESRIESVPCSTPTGILKAKVATHALNSTAPKVASKPVVKSSRAVMFSTTVTVDDGSEVVRLNCTLDESELGKNAVPPTEETVTPNTRSDQHEEITSNRNPPGNNFSRQKRITDVNDIQRENRTELRTFPQSTENRRTKPSSSNDRMSARTTMANTERAEQMPDSSNSAPIPPPRRSSQASLTTSNSHSNSSQHGTMKKEYENLDTGQPSEQFPSSTKRSLPLPASPDPT